MCKELKSWNPVNTIQSSVENDFLIICSWVMCYSFPREVPIQIQILTSILHNYTSEWYKRKWNHSSPISPLIFIWDWGKSGKNMTLTFTRPTFILFLKGLLHGRKCWVWKRKLKRVPCLESQAFLLLGIQSSLHTPAVFLLFFRLCWSTVFSSS